MPPSGTVGRTDNLYEFVSLPTFLASAKKLLSAADLRVIENELCRNLYVGDVMPRTGGFRKMRYALRGRGKSGGARVIYLPDEPCERVYLVLAYPKNKKDTLTRAEEAELRKLSKALRDEEC